MKDFLAKTNSWHWLVAALVVCGTVSAFLWNRQIEAVRAERDPALARMSAHLEALRALLPDGPETLDAQTASLKTRLEALRQEVVDAGFAPIPEGADAVLAASIFHFGTYTVPQAKEFLQSRNIPVRPADR